MELSVTVLWHLAAVAVRALGLAGLAWVVMLVCRVQAAAARHAVWTLVTLGMLVLGICEPLLPPLPLRVLRAPAETAVVSAAPAASPIAAPAAAPAPVGPQRDWPSWPQLAAALYALVVIAGLTRLGFGYLFTRRLLKASRPIDRRMPDAGAPELLESDWISVPMTLGLIRPRILLPRDWREWEPAKLEAVLAHEQTHVERADWAIAVAAGLNRSIFWFHPLAWWLERHLATLAEQACDDASLLRVATATYAQALLDMAAAVKTGQGRLVWEAMAMANVAEVRRRIERILDETRQIPQALNRSHWTALIAGSLPVVYLISVLQLAPVRAQEAVATGAPAAIGEMLKGGRKLTAGDATALEQYLSGNPHDLDARSQLILYYFSLNVREPRLGHILWLIANHPESSQAAFASQGITARTSAYNDTADFARAAALWDQQVAAHPRDTRVLVNAAQFQAQPGGNSATAERLLKEAASIDSSVRDRLGRFYAAAILGSTGDPKFPSLDDALASRARLELENSNDGMLLHFAGTALVNVARRPETGRALPAGSLNLDDHPMLLSAVDLGNRLLIRADGMGVHTGPTTIGAAPANRPTAQIAPAASGTEPVLASMVHPEYPALAKQARIQGTVRLQVTIGTDGHVTHIEVITGHPLLVPAGIEAVKQWVFRPVPAPTTTEIQVPFTLSGAEPALVSPALPSPQPASIAPPTLGQAPPLVKRVEPEYPPLAKQARISGTVRIMATIGADGQVTHLQVINGHPLLVGAALEAVKQWVYAPIPVAGTAEIHVDFTLPPSDNSTGAMWALTPRKGSLTPTLRIGAQVQASQLISKVDPIYPDTARAVGIEGSVTLDVTIGVDGHVEKVSPREGHPALAAAAMDAVKQWVYQPTRLRSDPSAGVETGTPVTVITTVTVTFP